MKHAQRLFSLAAGLLGLGLTAQAQAAGGLEELLTMKRLEMVEQQIKARGVTDERTLEAMRRVPRHRFIPKLYLADAYGDYPLPIGEGQTISQPYIVGFMTEQLELRPGCKVLEVGTGSGYQAAVLSSLCGHVYTIEILPGLGKAAEERLKELGCNNVTVKIGDGYHGWKEHAPFDAIIVTAAASSIPEDLIEQLKPGGTMVIPVGETLDIQNLIKVEKHTDGSVSRQNLLPVRFVPLTGEH